MCEKTVLVFSFEKESPQYSYLDLEKLVETWYSLQSLSCTWYIPQQVLISLTGSSCCHLLLLVGKAAQWRPICPWCIGGSCARPILSEQSKLQNTHMKCSKYGYFQRRKKYTQNNLQSYSPPPFLGLEGDKLFLMITQKILWYRILIPALVRACILITKSSMSAARGWIALLMDPGLRTVSSV